MTARGENPFCSRRIRPGAMPFLFPAGLSAAAVLEHLERSGGRGEIVGPHGSGKSSLVAALVERLEAAGREVCLVTLHDGQRRMPRGFYDAAPPSGGLVIVDGYEQLARLERFRLGRFCRAAGAGMLVTSHRTVGFPEIHRTAPTVEAAQAIVAELQRGYPAYVTAEDVKAAYVRHAGDLRELLFELYDLYRDGDFSTPPDGNPS